MTSIRAKIFSTAALFLALTAATSLRAQLPIDSNVWKERCTLLSNNADKIQNGTAPAVMVSATRGIPGPEFYTMAVNRAEDQDHYVACTFYYMAALAERNGNGGKRDDKIVQADAILAASELRMAQHQHLTMAQHVKRFEMKATTLASTLTLDQQQSHAVLVAGTTFPITLTADNDPLLQPVASLR